ncbi:hypothetical protein ACTOB_005154 [Actinoplanes oblitus]|uniref:Lipoprotein n=1 Tax=Actinoplanes oblitus TaxID=3040509 RepID=A0ABY8W826_9ACTN|nr:hypothetical protein [Actinoplanes oblitus]WIM93183.1 hypothetical protein ACTOB_005154 [Actinoplanes oblitus]
MTRTKSRLLLCALVVAGIAGCDAGGPAVSPSASASGNRQQLLALGQEWVRCLRDHGLTRMPDVELSQEGYLQFPAVDGYNWKEDLRTHRDIINACQSIEDRYPPNAFRPRQQFSADDLRKLAAYAKCVREHGVPDFPDPNAAGEFDVTGTSLEHGIPGRLRDQADAACHTIWSGDVRVTGGTGGRK